MKNIAIFSCFVALLSFGSTLRAGEEPSLNVHLQPLKSYLGEWKMCWTDPNGRHLSGTASFKPEAAGAIILLKVELFGAEQKPAFTRTSVFYWNSALNSLAESTFTSDGGFGANVLSKQAGNKSIWTGEIHSPAGKGGCAVTEIVKTSDDRWTAQFVKQILDGIPMPDSPKFTFTRAK